MSFIRNTNITESLKDVKTFMSNAHLNTFTQNFVKEIKIK